MISADEKFVREHWDDVKNIATPRHPFPVVQGKDFAIPFAEWDEGWKAAAEYTRNRIEEIRQVLRDIQFIQEYLDQSCDSSWRPIAAQSIFARLQAALAELKRGMK